MHPIIDSVRPEARLRKALVGIAIAFAIGCGGGNAREPSRPQALTYTANLEPRSNEATTPPEANSAGPPRLVRHAPNGATANGVPAGMTADTDPHAVRGPAIGGGPPPTVEPAMEIPAPPATWSIPPRASFAAAQAAIPPGVPTGHLDRDKLEGPLRDRSRYERCRIPQGTRARIDALVYNGAAVGVDVHTMPIDQPLEFCIEQVVRETSWVVELAVNRVSLTL
jgi:hypothetical protein